MELALGASQSAGGEAFAFELSGANYRKIHAATTASMHFDNVEEVSQLRTVRDAYVLFGLNPDDRAPRREQVKMWDHISSAMSGEVAALTSAGRPECYDAAKQVDAALDHMRDEFLNLETADLKRAQAMERNTFSKAAQKLHGQLRDAERGRTLTQESRSEAALEQLREAQRIERDNFDYARAITVPAKQRYSKRVLELRRAETGLSALGRFDEAKNVRAMIDKLEAPERKAHLRRVSDDLAKGSAKLRNEHESQRKRVDERLGEVKWAGRRSAAREFARQAQRLRNLDCDMTHANRLDVAQKPELVVHQSALLQKRRNYHQTTSTKNGQRLLDSVLGKKKDEAVYVANLCATHDFERPLSGTVAFERGKH